MRVLAVRLVQLRTGEEVSAFEWRYKRRDDATGQVVQEDWRPRPDGSSMNELWMSAQLAHGDDKAAPFGVESRPVQEAPKP